MKRIATTLGATLLAGSALAGGIEISNQSVGVLFEEGTYFQLSLGVRSPDLSGTALAIPPTGQTTDTGDVGETTFVPGLAYKRDVGDRFSVALIYDMPYGADIAYDAGTFYGGTEATASSFALTALASYHVTDRVQVFGGIRAQQIEANVDLQVAGGASLDYQVDIAGSTAFGYSLGVAYVRPELAQKFSITYHSAITHETEATETGLLQSAIPFANNTVSDIEIQTPQSINIEAQTGINPKTLVFGSIRWVNWSETEVAPAAFANSLGRPLLSYEDDTITYTLGVGRKITDKLSMSASVAYEAAQNDEYAPLSVTDGYTGINLGASYDLGNGLQIAGGVSYNMVGNTQDSRQSALLGGMGSETKFEDNNLLGFGIRISKRF